MRPQRYLPLLLSMASALVAAHACAQVLSPPGLPLPGPRESGSPLHGPLPKAAAAPAVAGKTADRYGGESYVIEHADGLYSFNADGTGFRELTQAVKVQSEAAVRELGILSIGFAGASERVEIQYARVRQPDGTVIETPVADALEQPQPVTREAPFYSDLKQKQLPIRSLRIGDTLEWKVRVVRTKAEATGEFWGETSFTRDAVTLAETLEVRVPQAVTVNVWTNPGLKLAPVETTAGGQRVLRWQTANLKPTAGPDAEAEAKRLEKEVWTPEQELDAREGKLPSVAWTTFKSWADVGAWYRGLEGDRMEPDAALKAKVAELTAGKTTTEDKVRAVYGFVSPQVRYIGVAFGVGRYQPHRAEEVLDNQYGDCKDKHTLLAAMLIALGLHPDAVLVGADIRFNQAVPSPAAFNHLITLVDVDGKPLWLDSTAEVAPLGMLSVPIRDKRALVVPGTGPAHIERTPALPPFPSFQTTRISGSLTADGTETSQVTLTTRGDTELVMREVLHQIAPAQYGLFAQKFWEAMGFSGTTSDPAFSNPEETAEPLKLAFDVKREKAGGDWEHLRIVAQLLPMGLPEVDEKTPPTRAIELGPPQTILSSYSLRLPEGWGAELPEAIHEKASFATYDLTFRIDKGTLYADRKLVVLEDKVPVDGWRGYKQWFTKVQPNSSPYIQLTRSRHSGDAGSKTIEVGPPPLVNNAEAAKLVQEALTDLQRMNVTDAEPLLNHAKQLNDRQELLWAAYGYLSYLRGANNEALRDYRKELTLHPNALTVYPPLVSVELSSRRRDEAEADLRQWAAADPGNARPSIQLSALQLEDNHPGQAYATMEGAIAKLPEDARKADAVQLALGNAEMKNGMQPQAAKTLVELLKTTDDPLTLNDGAYALSEGNLNLPEAEAAERKALGMMDAETQSWTLDEAPALLKEKTSLLAASWDTMGWILYREGKYTESRSFVQAAWHNRSDAVVGEHLGDIEMALGKPGPALNSYELAKSAGGPVGVLDGKEAGAKKAGGKVTSIDAARELVELRTVQLGDAHGHYGAAEYKLLLSHGKVDRVEPAGDKTVPGGLEILQAMQVPQWFPAGSEAKLARNGILNCHVGQCEMVFLP